MTISYTKDQGEIYLDRIDYTGNGSLPSSNYVKFIRDDGSRTDAHVMYTTKFIVKTAYRVSSIEVRTTADGNDRLIRKYLLEYDANLSLPGFQYSESTGRSLLGKITQYGTDGTSVLPSITFTWQKRASSGFDNPASWSGLNYLGVYPWRQIFADVNGDGRADWIHISGSGGGVVHLADGNGGFNTESSWIGLSYLGPDPSHQKFADINGDGMMDWIHISGSGGGIVHLATGPYPDLLGIVDNGIGGTTTIAYQPSSAYINELLPFIVQTVSSVTVNDGNDISSTTSYTYSGGYYDYGEREYRGFQYVEATAPNGTTTESWFKGCNYPPVSGDNIFKGLLEEQITKDLSGNIFTRTYNTFLSTSPYTGVNFPYLSQKDDYIYDGTLTAKQATASFTYDSYGNITRKYLWGDVSITGDERDEYMEYNYDTTRWIVSHLSYSYLKDSDAVTKAQAWFTYDVKGNLLTKTDWLSGGTNPVTTYIYDSYGNVETVKDPRDNTSTITYDTTTHTYPVTVQDPLGHTAQKTYDYKFGKVLTETDPNTNTITYQYDVFGRITKVTGPYDGASTYGTISYYYLDLGTVGSQKVMTYATEQSGTGNYIWSEVYFDGIGKTFKTKTEGPDNKAIETQTIYDERGLVESETFPYFVNSQGAPLETPRWRTYQYDPIGRITRTDNPDGTYATSSYLKGVLSYIDPNGHKKVEGKDIYGRTIKIEEYTGTSTSFTLYATTTYEYDILGNLKKVTDANSNQSTMTYDTLSRKTSMTDPDMGYWTYQYDVNGNLTSQTDAKGQTITFTYDVLNRITVKDYPAGTDVTYAYDETFSTYPKGRLTTVTDASGTAKFYYDKLGRTTKTIKTVDSVNYTTELSYDALGRTDTLTYPDSTVLKYEYDTGGNLMRVKNNTTDFIYAAYTNYNALGQTGRTDYGNGVNTIYQYLTQNNRLYSITTSKQSTGLINLSYAYDSIGNITGITDHLDSTRDRNYGYDDLNRLTSATSTSYGGTLTWQYNEIGNMTYNSRYGNYYYNDSAHKHAVTNAGSDTYTYDANGNMTGGAGRTFTYDYDNRATSIAKDGAATINVYDASGQRVKKVTPGFTAIYIGKHYECSSGVCTKYIFAGSDRIVSIEGSNTRYYHSDHLGSSSVITDQNGVSVQSIYYYPYGEIHTNSGSDVARHKFTGQEYDAETELYYYNARYYDPRLAKFTTADTIVLEPFYPQALNRYSYCINNPAIFTDPSGHLAWWADMLIGAAAGAIGAGIASDWDGEAVWKGAVAGAVVGLVANWASGYVGSVIGSAVGCGAYCTTTAYYAAEIAGGATTGAIAGAAGGATLSALYGGNIGQGAMYGAMGGAVFGGIGGYYGSDWGLGRVAVTGLAGGGVSEITGGTFGEGFLYAAGGAALFWAYTKMVGFGPDYGPGEKLEDGTYWPDENYRTPQGKAVIGYNERMDGSFRDNFRQGSWLMRGANHIPGINAVAHLHDYWGNLMEAIGSFNLMTNVGTMLPAVAISYGSSLGSPLGPTIYTTMGRYTD